MNKKIKILLLEDTSYDVELILRMLKKDNLNFSHLVVDSLRDFERGLQEFSPDIILSDHSLAQFNSSDALRISREHDPYIPFIIVTATVSEEFAAEIMRKGADDYILKRDLTRLPLAVHYALERREALIAKIQVQEKLIQTEKQIRGFAEHLHHAQEEERARIAREIHDELGQQLAGLKINLSMLKRGGNNTEERINELMKDIDVTIQSMKRIATQLRPGILDTLGLIPSIQWLAKEFEKKTNIKCSVNISSSEEKQPASSGFDQWVTDKNISICLFRICQEALTNILKHADASEVQISMLHDTSSLLLKISDNGKGISSEKMKNPFSMGLIGMKERAKIIGADLTIESRKDSGTVVELKAQLN